MVGASPGAEEGGLAAGGGGRGGLFEGLSGDVGRIAPGGSCWLHLLGRRGFGSPGLQGRVPERGGVPGTDGGRRIHPLPRRPQVPNCWALPKQAGTLISPFAFVRLNVYC